ncbi:unnamed protein product [Coffea canephora]|uniref:DH200=94 genomic scaffold, scaffold_2208 n=1 Tax=Coffea canephora TaxID=49390 RepID=A0A068VMT5_COFCA|nr:unnamed protein product [Coffea canephora]
MNGSHAVLLAPQKHLLGFQKLHLTPQTEGLVEFNVHVCKHLSMVDKLGKRKIATGKYMLHVEDLKHRLTVTVRI